MTSYQDLVGFWGCKNPHEHAIYQIHFNFSDFCFRPDCKIKIYFNGFIACLLG
jgi:hypothetical protein